MLKQTHFFKTVAPGGCLLRDSNPRPSDREPCVLSPLDQCSRIIMKQKLFQVKSNETFRIQVVSHSFQFSIVKYSHA